MSRWIRRALISLGALLICSLVLLSLVLWVPNTFVGDRFVTVSRGESFRQVMDSLETKKVIRSRLLFSAAGRLLGLTTSMQVGKYRFRSGMSNQDILQDLREGKSIVSITVTIPEGVKATRMARMYTRALDIDSSRFISLVNDPGFIASVGVSAPSLEGYLMPDTYRFYWQSAEEDILKGMVQKFWTVYDSSLQRRTQMRGSNLNEILTLASIVEAETPIDSERAIVAGVYYNRLQKRMPLQADPTVQYILPDGPRRLHMSDLQRESPYNTYRHYGLPPGPINNPGRESILAALYPRRHRYLFFVATGQGGHTFTRSFDEHKKAARQFHRYQEEKQSTMEER